MIGSSQESQGKEVVGGAEDRASESIFLDCLANRMGLSGIEDVLKVPRQQILATVDRCMRDMACITFNFFRNNPR